ncbi:hypothetical protein HID58_001664, partial [Brassica napus]
FNGLAVFQWWQDFSFKILGNVLSQFIVFRTGQVNKIWFPQVSGVVHDATSSNFMVSGYCKSEEINKPLLVLDIMIVLRKYYGVEAKNNEVREGDAWISCDRKTSLKVEVLKRTNDFEGEASQEDENEVNYESKYSEDEEDKRKGSFDPKKGSKIVNKMGRVPKSRAQNLR